METASICMYVCVWEGCRQNNGANRVGRWMVEERGRNRKKGGGREKRRGGRGRGFRRRVKRRQNRRKDEAGKRKGERKCGVKSLKKVGNK